MSAFHQEGWKGREKKKKDTDGVQCIPTGINQKGFVLTYDVWDAGEGAPGCGGLEEFQFFLMAQLLVHKLSQERGRNIRHNVTQ